MFIGNDNFYCDKFSDSLNNVLTKTLNLVEKNISMWTKISI